MHLKNDIVHKTREEEKKQKGRGGIIIIPFPCFFHFVR